MGISRHWWSKNILFENTDFSTLSSHGTSFPLIKPGTSRAGLTSCKPSPWTFCLSLTALQAKGVLEEEDGSDRTYYRVELYDPSTGQDVLVAGELASAGHGKLSPSALSFLVRFISSTVSGPLKLHSFMYLESGIACHWMHAVNSVIQRCHLMCACRCAVVGDSSKYCRCTIVHVEELFH